MQCKFRIAQSRMFLLLPGCLLIGGMAAGFRVAPLCGLWPMLAAVDPAALAAPPLTPSQEIPEVLTRGPVHEAFAQPVNVQVQGGVVVHQQPPATIREIPPADRPRGDHNVWVPGYWSWDMDRNNFIWVSGCWRVTPPNMNWVPGYWAAVDNGWEWVPGFWTTANTTELNYLPSPPATQEIDPPGAPPDEAADMWVPGCWYWVEGQYVLRHGYWLHQQTGWVWVPSHYCWTPRGYVFAPGHWDYTLEQRGLLFAPVCFSGALLAQPDYVYSPDVCVDLELLTDCLFAYPCYSHYFFGDYYDSFYFGCGIYPWFACTRFHIWCCPTFDYCRWQGCLRDRDWELNVRHAFDQRCLDRTLRPSWTLAEQNLRVAALPPADRGLWLLGKRVTAVAAAESGNFSQMDLSARNEMARQANDVHVFRTARTRWEQPFSAGAASGTRASSEITPAARAAEQPGSRTGASVPPVAWTPLHATPNAAREAPAATASRVYHEFRPTYEPPRDVFREHPEQVRIPAAPFSGRTAAAGSSARLPPSRPALEQAAGSGNQRRER